MLIKIDSIEGKAGPFFGRFFYSFATLAELGFSHSFALFLCVSVLATQFGNFPFRQISLPTVALTALAKCR